MAGLIRRGNTYYLVYSEGQGEKRVSLRTDSFQIAKEKKHVSPAELVIALRRSLHGGVD